MSFFNDLILGFDPAGREVSLPLSQLNRHVYVAGRSGSGKSKFLEHLVCQLLRAWPKTRAGMLVIDPHAHLYQSLISWAAASGYNHLPIVPFDLRGDWICSLNIVRPRPGQDPAPLLHAAVRAILQGWGQGDTTETPRLAKWLMTLLATLYASRCTMLEALDIIRSPEIRAAMARHVEDEMAKSVWMASARLKEADFQSELESTMNRLGRFLSTRVLKLAFGQSDVSLDMHSAMERGHIVVAALATEGSRIAEEDAAVVGSLLLSETWTAAKHRGKRDNGQHRQFTVVIDEFQQYISPVIAQSLAQLRGMGVGFVMAHQSPQQLLDMGQTGRQVLNAIVSNTMTQVIFQSAHPADLDLFAPWLYRNQVNPDAIKHQHYATRVLDHEINYHQSSSRSTSRGTATSTNWSTTESVGQTTGTSVSHTDARGTSMSVQQGRSTSQSSGVSTSDEAGVGMSAAESAADGVTQSRGSGCSRQTNHSQSENRGLDGEYDELKKVVGAEPTATFDRAYVDEDEGHRGLHRSIGQTESEGESQSTSESEGVAATHSRSQAKAVQASRSHSQGSSHGVSDSESEGETEGLSHTSSDGISRSESTSTSTAEMTGGSDTTSESTTEGITLSPMLTPKLGKEALPPLFAAVEEQLFRFSQLLSSLPDRHAVVRTGSTPPVEITTPTVTPAGMSAKGARAWATLRLKKLPFALPVEEAARRLQKRQRDFETKYLTSPCTDEPTTTVRRIRRKDHG